MTILYPAVKHQPGYRSLQNLQYCEWNDLWFLLLLVISKLNIFQLTYCEWFYKQEEVFFNIWHSVMWVWNPHYISAEIQSWGESHPWEKYFKKWLTEQRIGGTSAWWSVCIFHLQRSKASDFERGGLCQTHHRCVHFLFSAILFLSICHRSWLEAAQRPGEIIRLTQAVALRSRMYIPSNTIITVLLQSVWRQNNPE